ncbi:SAP domain-containing protein [Staphylococcus pseudoxylosus]|uniref:SAP domain-containing protein n=1 Tax=Staphylococcus TaxID=1279 RepID=UPI001E5BC868|nr:SAP domain-containing protein [Staphylococcus xylosus]MCD8851670.1 SAP domain-containing protein [Staphylococcus xylosus]
MELNAYDLLILHLNVNRKVGNEVTNHNYLIENKISVKNHLKNLIDNKILVLKSDYDNSLPLLKVTELKKILRNNNLKVGGKKQELIERIKENIPIEDVELDEVYVATSSGKELLKETDYILHFYNSHLISLASAHNIANQNINSEDKIETIYLTLIKHNNTKTNQYNLTSILNSLINYYKKIGKDENYIRQYINLYFYLEFYRDLELQGYWFEYEEDKNIFDYFYISSDYLEYYENQLLIKNVNEQTLKTLFYKDITLFVDANKNLCEDFFNIIISKVHNIPLSIEDFPYINKYLDEQANTKPEKYNFRGIEARVTRNNSISNSSIRKTPNSSESKVTTKSQEPHNNSNSFTLSQSKNNNNNKMGLGCLWILIALSFFVGVLVY